MSKGNRNRDKRRADDAKVAAAFARQPQLPVQLPGLPRAPAPVSPPPVLPAKALRRKIGAALADANEEFYAMELACILWALHKYAGWGKKKLTDFTRQYRPIVEELTEFYGYEYLAEEAPFACERALREEVGIDVKKLKLLEV